MPRIPVAWSRRCTAASAFTLAGLAVLALAGPAAARPTTSPRTDVGCFQDSCLGKDPQAMGCDTDAVTGAWTWTRFGALVELRWSNACQAAWGKISHARPGDWVGVGGPGKTSATWTIQDGYTYGWTNMVRDMSYVDKAYACGFRTALNSACTDSY
ncbi:DUF2690 domain-containing protein [Streptomyces sp. NBC_00079]|uniref:DUF2690 domain-containing protein n=1 Tax=Streptomyces sp. NBC_00079 TaxID=2975644 RepID=UPI00324F1894